jgi:hypothetical protein
VKHPAANVAAAVSTATVPQAKATKRADGMNKLEAAWAEELEKQKQNGEIVFYRYSPCGLRLADKTFYHPDFLVIEANGTVRFDETKGFMRDDANVKIKVAASQFPFVFRLIKRKGKSWEITTI